MGLFGESAEKKLEKAQELLDAGRYYDARKGFSELVRKGTKLSESLAQAALEGERRSREEMIRERLAEANAYEKAGEIASARDRVETALDLAGTDVDRSSIEEYLRRLTSQPREAAPTGAAELPADLLADRPDREIQADQPPEPPEEDVFGPDLEETFEFYMATLVPEQAALFRSQPEAFRRAYLAAVQGAPKLALRYFDELGSDGHPPEVELERARALLLDRRSEDALVVLDAIEAPDTGVRWTRVEVLRDLDRREEAIEAAVELVNSMPGHEEATDALLAWTLLDAGRPADAWEHLEGWVRSGTVSEEVVVPAAQAASLVGRSQEARELLEGLIQHRLHVSLQSGREPSFPVQAGRRLLQILLDQPPDRQDRAQIRTLTLHLLDYDEVNGEVYRGLLLRF